MKRGEHMADYILGALLVLLFILAARSYFGKKFGGGCSCGCQGCPRSQACGHAKNKDWQKLLKALFL